MDLRRMTDAELNHAQYEMEHRYAEMIRASKPFSEERQRITRDAYAEVDLFVDERNRRSGGLASYGASDYGIKIISAAIQLLRTEGNTSPIVFYEAGVGTGYIISSLSQMTGIELRGSDVYLTENLKRQYPLLDEMTTDQSLRKLPDQSVDIFYWNDVMEHIPEDEIDTLLNLMAAKCKPNGLLITMTPNAHSGPHDITRLANPAAPKACGLHLKEYTLREILSVYKRTGWQIAAYVKEENLIFRYPGLYTIIHSLFDELCHHPILSKILPGRIRKNNHYVSTTIVKTRKK